MKQHFIILLVDDDEDDQDMFREALDGLEPRIECYTAQDGEEALMLLGTASKQLPDFIFLDLNMPRVNGRQCLQSIRKAEKYNGIPVIIYSTLSRPADVEELIRLGAAYYFTKPTTLSVLREELQGVLSGELLYTNN
jgi:CheY-like chemotaxis protein